MNLIVPPNPAPRVAIQGERGSNSHMAALQVLGPQAAALVTCSISAEVFERLDDGSATLAVLPIENSLHGSVFEHYDLLLDHQVSVIGETMLQIRHNVIAAPGVTLDGIRRLTSHPVALSQCRRWLRTHPAIEVVPGYDTAGSVKQLMASGSRDQAGIAPLLAATEYGAEVLVTGIEDHPENYTRFYVLRRGLAEQHRNLPGPDTPNDKASLAFSLEHRPGSLIAALEVLNRQQLNLTRIESRPVPGKPWEYVFFVDVRLGHEDHLDAALHGLAERCQMVRELGRYTAAAAPGSPSGDSPSLPLSVG